MSAAPARRRSLTEPVDRSGRRASAAPSSPASQTRAVADRRRRERHFARRRQDLRQDVAIALVVSVLLICVTAGLGVLALLMAAVSAALATSLIAERWLRRRRAPVRRAGVPRRSR